MPGLGSRIGRILFVTVADGIGSRRLGSGAESVEIAHDPHTAVVQVGDAEPTGDVEPSLELRVAVDWRQMAPSTPTKRLPVDVDGFGAE
jgi:hypothetical protein